jgi:hypothetical protein
MRRRRPIRRPLAKGSRARLRSAATGLLAGEKRSRREALRACQRGLEPSSKPSSEPSSCATGLAPDPPCKCTPFAPAVCMTTPPQRRLVVVMQSLGMVEQEQGGSGAIGQWSCGESLGLFEGIGRSENNFRNCKTTWSDEAIIGSLRGEGASAWGGCEERWRVGGGGRFARRLGAGLVATGGGRR